VYPTPRDASTVILLRPTDRSAAHAFEVFLVRRVRGASFMSSASVFPGGAADDDDGDPRVTAARELFEEAGVLVARPELDPAALPPLRRRVLDGEPFGAAVAGHGAAVDLDRFHYYGHWVTPSIEPKRFSARFYVAVLPAGQDPSFDARETVEQAWVTPGEALDRRAELRLPPPQVRSFHELSGCRTVDDVLALAARRALAPFPILPRLAPQPGGVVLLLPWDPEYETAGTGDAAPLPCGHPLADGPSRFSLEGGAWEHR
jgi:8-oxo-dGTP pyrophosphatase MutT (NUDIX family)